MTSYRNEDWNHHEYFFLSKKKKKVFLFNWGMIIALQYCVVSAIRVVSSTYLMLLTFLPAILIPACASSSPAFLMMYSVYKLNKHGDNIQLWPTPFPIWNQSVVSCLVLLLLVLHTDFSGSRSGHLVFSSL